MIDLNNSLFIEIGDSGGPLVSVSGESDGTLVGVASFGIGCGRENYPGVYANVASVRSWIDRNVF